MSGIAKPTDKKSAELFLRNEAGGIYSLVKLGRYFDKLRIVIKGTNRHQHAVTLQLIDELPLDDKENYQAKFLAMAQVAHAFWSTLDHDCDDS